MLLMENLESDEYGVPNSIDAHSAEIQFAWKMAIKQLSRLTTMQTPRAKLCQIGKAIEII